MPVMPRPNGKAKRIAYDILGKPSTMHDKKTSRDIEIDKVIYRDQVQRQK